MSAVKGSRQRLRRADSLVHLYAQIAPDAKAVVDRAAEAAKVPKAEVLEEILRHVQLEDDGLPTWWPRDEAPGQLALDAPPRPEMKMTA